jgi:hypothetical protein
LTNYLVAAEVVSAAVEVATSEALAVELVVAFPEALEVASEEHDVTIAKTATKINVNFFIVFVFYLLYLISRWSFVLRYKNC